MQEWTARLVYEVTGRRKEKSKSAASRLEANILLSELEQEFVAGGQAQIESGKMMFEQLV